MSTYSLIIAITVDADDQDDAERQLVSILPYDHMGRVAVGGELLRATAHDDGGRTAENLANPEYVLYCP